MAQFDPQITTVAPLSGLNLVQAMNQALESVVTDFSGTNPPTKNVFPYSTWADTATGTLKRRNAANTAWVIEGRLLVGHLPMYAQTDVPATDIGPIYIIGKGPAEWSVSAYKPTADAPSDGLVYGRKNGAWAQTDTYRPTFIKEYDDPCLFKAGSSTPKIRAGLHVNIAGAYVNFNADTAIADPTGGYLAGSDYSVWVKPDGTAVAVADPFSAPAVAPVAGAVKIGGFHYGLVAPGATVASGGFSTSGVTSSGGSMAWAQADVDRLAGINEFSIWDLAFRCKGEQRGMVFEPLYREWWGIYMMSTNPDVNGPSRYNTDVASGTVLPFVPAAWGGNGVLKYAALDGWAAHELASRFNHHLPLYDRFMAAAFGVTEGQSLGGASVTTPATARQPGYTSRIGVEQATGHQWLIGASTNAVGGSAYAGNGRGSWYGSYGLPLFGGSRADAANSGSRAALFLNALSNSFWNCSVRVAGDHLNLGRTAR